MLDLAATAVIQKGWQAGVLHGVSSSRELQDGYVAKASTS